MQRSKLIVFIGASLLILGLFNISQQDRYTLSDSTYSRWLSEFRNGKPDSPVQVVVEFIDPRSGEKSERLEVSSEATGWDKLLRLLEVIETGNLLAHANVPQPVLDIEVASTSDRFRGQVDMQQFSEQAEPALFLALVRESIRVTNKESKP